MTTQDAQSANSVAVQEPQDDTQQLETVKETQPAAIEGQQTEVDSLKTQVKKLENDLKAAKTGHIRREERTAILRIGERIEAIDKKVSAIGSRTSSGEVEDLANDLANIDRETSVAASKSSDEVRYDRCMNSLSGANTGTDGSQILPWNSPELKDAMALWTEGANTGDLDKVDEALSLILPTLREAERAKSQGEKQEVVVQEQEKAKKKLNDLELNDLDSGSGGGGGGKKRMTRADVEAFDIKGKTPRQLLEEQEATLDQLFKNR